MNTIGAKSASLISWYLNHHLANDLIEILQVSFIVPFVVAYYMKLQQRMDGEFGGSLNQGRR